MKINIKLVLCDLDNVALKDETGKPLTLGHVLNVCALSAPSIGQTYTQDIQVKRYQLAISLSKEDEVDIDAATAAILKEDVARLYGPIVAGQVLPMLDGR